MKMWLKNLGFYLTNLNTVYTNVGEVVGFREGKILVAEYKENSLDREYKTYNWNEI